MKDIKNLLTRGLARRALCRYVNRHQFHEVFPEDRREIVNVNTQSCTLVPHAQERVREAQVLIIAGADVPASAAN